MKYFHKNGYEFVENGKSLIRVQTVRQMPSPHTKGRIVRVMHVDDILRNSDTNPIQMGMAIALSFPASKINAKEYEWGRNNMIEETQIPFKMTNG